MGTVIGHIRSISADIMRAAHTRLSLFTVELHQEKAWLLRQIMMGTAALFLGIFALFLGVLCLLASLPESDRPMALGIAAVIFVLLAGATLLKLVLDGNRRTGMKATLRVLEDDIRSLGGKHE